MVPAAVAVCILLVTLLVMSRRGSSAQGSGMAAAPDEELTATRISAPTTQPQKQTGKTTTRPQANELPAQLAHLHARVCALTKENAELTKRIAELQAMVASLIKKKDQPASPPPPPRPAGDGKDDRPTERLPITKVVFDIAGMRIGDHPSRQFRAKHGLGKDDSGRSVTVSDGFMINNTNRIDISYTFENDCLKSVELQFDSELFPIVVQVYTEKFRCPPHYYETKEMETKFGIKYTHERVMWETTSGPFILSKYDPYTGRGYGVLRRELRQLQEQELKRRL